jgi:hypothetical protein
MERLRSRARDIVMVAAAWTVSGGAMAACPEGFLDLAFGPGAAQGSTAGMVDDFGASCGSGAFAPDVAFDWVAPGTGNFTFDTFGSAYDTVLHLRDGSCDGPELACNDDWDGSLQSRVTVFLAGGASVGVIVDGFQGAAGSFLLNIAGDCAECGDADGDGTADFADNCLLVANVGQADADGDFAGDACDVCVNVQDPAQIDADGDGLGDACDALACFVPFALFTDDFESGAPGWSPQDLWHFATDPTCAPTAVSGVTSWYHGLDVTCTYDTGVMHAGTLVSPVVADVPPGLALEYWSRRVAEVGCGAFDLSRVLLSVNGSPFVVAFEECDISGAWRRRSVDLSPFVVEGDDIQLGFHFDTVDGQINGLLGWMIDDVTLVTCATDDVDGDGVPDGSDNCEHEPNPDQADADVDGYGDACCPTSDLGSADGPAVVMSTTVGGGDDFSAPCAPADAEDVAYRWTAPSAGTYTFDLFGSSFDTVLSLRSVTCGGTTIACNDDSGGLQSGVTVMLGAGEVVVVVVDGFQLSGGDFVLNIAEGACPTCADADLDGVLDGSDNCPFTPNPDQADPDVDLLGSACDNCPEELNPDQTDIDGDGTGDACQALACPSPPVLFQDGVELGVAGWLQAGLWHVVTEPACAPAAASGAKSWYYGQDPTCTYDTGLPSAATLLAPQVVDVPPGAALGYWSRRAAEQGCGSYDRARVVLSVNGAPPFPVFEECDGSGLWIERLFDLSPFYLPGDDLRVGFTFDTVDATLNAFLGWMVDDVRLVLCPQEDADGDGVADAIDNCPTVGNPGQEDGDGDGVGDACCSHGDLGSATGMAVATGFTPGEGNEASSSCGGTSAEDVGFLWTAPSTGLFTFDTFGSDFDTIVQVLDGSCSGPEIDCNDDTNGLQSSLTLDLASGQRVGVIVDGFSGASGAFALSIQAGGCAACLDVDGDLVPDGSDICPFTFDPGQSDADVDGVGDACDVCPFAADPGQADADADGIGDACDATAGCANPVPLFQDDVEAGGPGWTLDPPWHVLADPTCTPSSVSGTSSFYAGADVSCTYDTGVPILASLVTPVVGPAPEGVALDFWSRRQAEVGCGSFDRTVVLLGRNGEAGIPVFETCDGSGQWMRHLVDLTPFYEPGDALEVTFRFDTVDAELNGFLGWMIDDVAIVACEQVDSDGDGVPDLADNCPQLANADQADLDGDGLGDACCTQADLGSALGVSVQAGSTFGSGDDLSPSCAYSAAEDRAFRWTAPASDTFTFDTFGSAFDTILHVRDVSCGGPELACNDDTGSLQSQVVLSLAAGQQVVVAVDGYAEASGAFVLNIAQGACPGCGDPDGDGIPDFADSCDVAFNPDQADTDFDDVGDACDRCPDAFDPGQEDADGDGVGDACDALGCPVPVVLFSDDVEAGGPGWAASGLWHVVADPACAPSSVSGTSSFYYGQDVTCTYATGVTNDGTLLSPVAAGMPAGAVLDFWSRRQTEGACGQYDLSTVTLIRNGGPPVVVLETCAEGGTWIRHLVDLAPFYAAGDDVQVGFAFDTGDDIANGFLGWMIDDVRLVTCATGDLDGDGVPELADNCPGVANAGQDDADRDDRGDACDACPQDEANDADGDGACGDVDNCPLVANPGQEDMDGDGRGDACVPLVGAVAVSPDPTDGAAEAVLVVEASTTGSEVTKIDVFVDSVAELGGTLNLASPAAQVVVDVPVNVQGLTVGRHELLVRATDATGAVSLLRAVPLTVSPEPIPVVLVQGYHLSEPGVHAEHVETWRTRISGELRRPAYVATAQDSWAAATANAAGVAATVALALAETGSQSVDIVAFDAGSFAALHFLDDPAGGAVRRLVLVAAPLSGWDLADGMLLALQAAAAGPAGQARDNAVARLLADAALPGLSTAGVAAFWSTHLPPDAHPTTEIRLLAAHRPPTGSDDLLDLASALALSGATVRTMRYDTVLVPPPLHDALPGDPPFFDAFLAVALEESSEGSSMATSGQRLVLATSAGAAPVQIALPAVQVATPVVPGPNPPAAGKITTVVSVDQGAQSATFTQVSTSTPIVMTVTDPQGKTITQASAAASSTTTFVASTSPTGPSLGKLVVATPTPGNWTVEVAAATPGGTLAGTTVSGKFTEVTALQAALTLNAASYRPGDTVTARLQLLPADAVVSASSARFVRPDGVPSTVTLRDDGVSPDAVAADRILSGAFVLPGAPQALGRWSVDATAAGTLRGQAFDRTATGLFDVTSNSVTPSGQYAAQLTKPGQGGTFGALAVEVGLQVAQPGAYAVSGKLAGPTGSAAGTATTTVQAATAGSVRATLEFPATAMSAPGASGKFTLAQLVVASAAQSAVVLSSQANVFETAPIAVGLLQADSRPALSFTSPHAGTPSVARTVTLSWQDADPDDDARIALFLDMDAAGLDGAPIPGAAQLSENDETDAFVLDVSGLAEGTYFPYAVIADGQSSVPVYAAFPVRVGRDSDGDGLTDTYETQHGLDPARRDAESDLDLDGLTNGAEAALGTLPETADTDGGGEPDGREVLYGRSPGSGLDDVTLPPGAVIGDAWPVGGSGAVSALDLVGLVRYLTGASAPTAQQLLRSDVAPAASRDAAAAPPLFARVGDARLDAADLDVLTDRALGRLTLEELR